MQCPQCGVDSSDLAGDDEHVFACPEGDGLWVDGSQLNALLLHSGLPGLDSLGGRADPDAVTGTCRGCGVSLARIEQTGRREALVYETCEDCGFVFVPDDGPVPAEVAAARANLVSFFKRFSVKTAAKR
jgi:rubredoxin